MTDNPVQTMLQRQRTRGWARAGSAAIALTVAIVAVAIAGRAPLSRSTPVNAASARAPVTALALLLAGVAVVALAALVALMRPARRRRGEDEPEEAREAIPVHWAWKVGAVLLPFALGAALAVAAVLGARSAGHPGRPGALQGHPASPAGPHRGAGAAGGGFTLPAWLPWTALGIVVVASVALAVARLRLRPSAPEEEPERGAARLAVDAAIGALDVGEDPRAAVIAAYAAMERTLAAHGVARSRTEAPREYLRRVLASAAGTESEVGTLTSLFEEARYSPHPVPERLREVALRALRSLRGRLGAAPAG